MKILSTSNPLGFILNNLAKINPSAFHSGFEAGEPLII